MADIGGVAGGFSQSIQDLQALGQMDTQSAQAQLYRTQAAKGQMELAESKRAEDLMMRMSGGGSDSLTSSQGAPDPVKILDRIGSQFIESGLVVRGSEMLNKAATIRHKQAQTMEQQSLLAEHTLAKNIKQASVLGGLYAQVTNQMQKDAADAQYQKITGEPSPFQGTSYDPLKAQKIVDGSLSAKDQMELELKNTQEARAKAAQASLIARRNAQIKELELKSRKLKLDIDTYTKQGGPHAPEVVALRKQRVETLRAQEALIKSKAIGATPETALLLPTSKGDMRKDRFYQTIRGPMQWDGDKFIPAAIVRNLSPSGSGLPGTGEDEDMSDDSEE